jgi:hypothetical protein
MIDRGTRNRNGHGGVTEHNRNNGGSDRGSISREEWKIVVESRVHRDGLDDILAAHRMTT